MIPQATKVIIGGARAIFRNPLAMSASLLAVSQYLSAILNLITNILMARMLGPTGYGLVAIAIAYPTLLWSFVGIKSVSVITRYVAAFRAKGQVDELAGVVKAGYLLDVLVSCLAFFLVSATCWWVSSIFYRQPDVGWMMVAYAASFPIFTLTGGSLAVLSAWERFRLLAGLEVLHPAFKLAFVAGLVTKGFGPAGAVIGMAVAQASIGVIMMVTATFLLMREGKGYWWRA